MSTVIWPDFYFVRHGETDWNRERRYQGTRDIPLNATGRRQADATGILLRQMLAHEGVDPRTLNWFASPLGRTRETMERMRAAFEVPLKEVHYDQRLIEISFGTLEGRLHSELSRERAVATGERDDGYWTFRPPEGENYDDVAARLLAFAGMITRHSVIVAHGGILRVLRHLVEGAPRAEVLNWPAPQGVIAHFKAGAMILHAADLVGEAEREAHESGD